MREFSMLLPNIVRTENYKEHISEIKIPKTALLSLGTAEFSTLSILMEPTLEGLLVRRVSFGADGRYRIFQEIEMMCKSDLALLQIQDFILESVIDHKLRQEIQLTWPVMRSLLWLWRIRPKTFMDLTLQLSSVFLTIKLFTQNIQKN